MRTAVILPRRYEGQFIYEARECGLAAKIDIPTPNALTPAQGNEIEQALYSHAWVRKQKIFQMVMLFDEIIIPGIDPTNDYAKLNKTGFFSFSSIDDYIQYAEKNNLYDDCIATSIYLKPALLPVLYKKLTSCYKNDIKNLSKKKFAENIYDTFFASIENGGASFSSDMCSAIEIARKRHRIIQDRIFSTYDLSKEDYDYLTREESFIDFLAGEIAYEYEYLNMLLDLSNNRNANIVNCEYQLARIGCESSDVTQMLKNYATVRVECRDIIGTLPKPTSLVEVLRLKEKKRPEIHRLRQVLSEFENTVRTSGEANAIAKVRHDTELAVRDLNQGISSLSKVGTWTTILSVPIAIAESLLHTPPVIGVPVGILGTAALIGTKIKEKNSSWINVIR